MRVSFLRTTTLSSVRRQSPSSPLPLRHPISSTDLRENNGRREVMLVNPWRSPTRTEPSSWTAGLREAIEGVDSEDHPGALVVEWDAVSSHFASIHVNWDPTVFDHSSTVHMCVPFALLPPDEC
jgi:calpain-7